MTCCGRARRTIGTVADVPYDPWYDATAVGAFASVGEPRSLVELDGNAGTPPPAVPAATEMAAECAQQLVNDVGVIGATLDRLDNGSGTTDDLADDLATIGEPLGAQCGMAAGLAMTELVNYIATQSQQRTHATGTVVHGMLGGLCSELDDAFYTYPAMAAACSTPTPTTTTVATPPPQPVVVIPTPTPAPASAYYENCDAARAAGAAPLYRGDPGYRSGLDRDDDGVACE